MCDYRKLSIALLSMLFSLRVQAQKVYKACDTEAAERILCSEVHPSIAGNKERIAIKNGDSTMTIGGQMKIEHFFDKNTYLFNNNLPDTLEYFKHCVDLNFDYVFGKEKFGYNAIEAYAQLRHKGVWGKAMSTADRDSGGAGAPSIVVLDGASLGGHTHDSSRTLVWMKEAWLQVSPNAIMNATNDDYLHLIKIGWVPFELGRGIALGGMYGAGKELLGLYNYGEDKATPGILLHGQIIKNRLSYDLYYSKFEERGKSFSGNVSPIRRHDLDAGMGYWRGDNKDNELFAARLQGVAVDNETYGKLNLEPYIFYNIARDQYMDINPDTDTYLGSFGLNLEHAYRNFEWGGEAAFNFGEEKLHAIDKNTIKYKKDANGYPRGYYTHLSTDNSYQTQAAVDSAGKAAAAVPYAVGTNDNSTNGIPGTTYFNGNKTDDRFRPAYTNKLRGWMGVLDAAYTFKESNIKLAASYAYASGDANPHETEVNKTYKGFIGLDEWYSGKRVPSVFMLDQRLAARPLSLTANSVTLQNYDPNNTTYKLVDIENDISFTDLHVLGSGATWTPVVGGKKVTLNPNMLLFWRASDSKKVVLNSNTDVQPSTDDASRFMGVELNTVAKCELLKDFILYGNFAFFVPGQYYEDVAGIPLNGDLYANLDQAMQQTFDPKLFRLAHDTAYHMNVGLEYKF